MLIAGCTRETVVSAVHNWVRQLRRGLALRHLQTHQVARSGEGTLELDTVGSSPLRAEVSVGRARLNYELVTEESGD